MTMTHLDWLRFSLSNTKSRLASARGSNQIAYYKHNIAMIEKEIAGEIDFLGKTGEVEGMSDDELLAELIK